MGKEKNITSGEIEGMYEYISDFILKNSKVINEIGAELENIYHVNYLYADFKKKEGYKRSIVLSHEYNLYRQDYCGCKFSKRKKID